MIFFSKQKNGGQRSSSTEACVSILGLFVAVGLVGGLAALIYGLVKGSASGVIGGGVVLGVSVVTGVILALVFIFCLKNVVDESNESNQQATNRGRQRHRRHHGEREPTTSHEVSHVTAMHRYDHQHRPPRTTSDAEIQMYSQNNNHSLTDSTYSNYSKQTPLSPSKVSSSMHLNQSHNSVNNPQHQLVMTSNVYQKSHQRH
ncbi:unnamed protein product [Adineta ricciae]|uniref:Uncharacterized protein n=1 Tax=Adineta ricciae TaxID=249248 RepID=A0A814P400_ADIRI|nr:unnamed protein product [Adineta ricciae]